MTRGRDTLSNVDATNAATRNPTEDGGAQWVRHMRLGDFEAAWRVSDRVLTLRAGQPCWHLPRHQQHVWNGAPLEGQRVLVRCYHGLGDTLQFIRFMPWLAARCPEVTVWAQPKLLPLLATMRGAGTLIPLHDGTPGVSYDVDIELMELPHIVRVTLDTIPAEVPYLHVPGAPRNGGAPRVGLVWRAGEWDERRSIPRPLLEPLLEAPGIEWAVLQPDATAAEWGRHDGFWPPAWDLLTYAQVVRSLDLLITIDSMPAHLAGAMGVPVWTLLPALADWRWMEGRADSPWYPSMRLFRQSAAGQWAAVIDHVASALTSLTSRHG